MREIKFRGKRVDNGEWVIGHLTSATRVKDGITTAHWLIGSDFDFHEVHPETIGQYTGLKDKDGKEIYEGDMIRQGSDLCFIRRCTGGFECQLLRELKNGETIEGSTYNFSYLSDRFCEVIGNIHDNPNLLSQ